MRAGTLIITLINFELRGASVLVVGQRLAAVTDDLPSAQISHMLGVPSRVSGFVEVPFLIYEVSITAPENALVTMAS